MKEGDTKEFELQMSLSWRMKEMGVKSKRWLIAAMFQNNIASFKD